jgi:cysteine-rich CPXCG protein
MDLLQEHSVSCPYCGENITVLVDLSVVEQQYIEDCSVCCAPILFVQSMQEDGNFIFQVMREND